MDGIPQKELRDAGKLYDANYDQSLIDERLASAEICHRLNLMAPADPQRRALLGRLLGHMGKNCTILSPFFCDYGYNLFVGDNFFANYNFVVLDCARVNIGDNVFIGPNCGLYTADHPLDPECRGQGLEWASPITIEDNVWIGGGVHILGGVSIGKGSVVGAGTVVSRSIPSMVVVAGNPARILRSIGEKDEKDIRGNAWKRGTVMDSDAD